MVERINAGIVGTGWVWPGAWCHQNRSVTETGQGTEHKERLRGQGKDRERSLMGTTDLGKLIEFIIVGNKVVVVVFVCLGFYGQTIFYPIFYVKEKTVRGREGRQIGANKLNGHAISRTTGMAQPENGEFRSVGWGVTSLSRGNFSREL